MIKTGQEKTWNELRDMVHANAVAHGWWEDERSMTEILNLCHCELSEAIEEDRNGNNLVWEGEHGKPEGVAIELADCVIRVLDLCGRYNISIPQFKRKHKKHDLQDVVALCHYYLGNANTWFVLDGCEGAFSNFMRLIVQRIDEWTWREGLSLVALIKSKHEYNVTRPYKHGKRY